MLIESQKTDGKQGKLAVILMNNGSHIGGWVLFLISFYLIQL